MPVNTPHAEYDAMADRWARMRDVLDGEDAVKERGAEYLPMLGGMDGDEYEGYLRRASFHAATARTAEGLAGAVFRKPIALEGAPELDDLGAVTAEGDDLETFARAVVDEVLCVGRVGILVDAPDAATRDAWLSRYATENIINWRIERVGELQELVLMVLAETARTIRLDDEFCVDKVERWRVLDLARPADTALDAGPFYRVRRFEKRQNANKEDEIVQVGPEIFPTRAGRMLDFIPFLAIGPSALDPCPVKPPLLALADVNLSHYRTSADLEHGAHFTALPTPYIAGDIQADKDGSLPTMRIGSGIAWLLATGATAGLLEYKGQGLGALEARLERKEKHMAVLGARLLEDQKAGVEAARTVELRHGGQNSVLAAIAGTASRGLTQALNMLLWWRGGGEPNPQSFTEPAHLTLNRDFFDQLLSAQDLASLVDSWVKGGIGGELLFEALRAGERLPDGWDFDRFKADLLDNGPGAIIGLEPEPDPEPEPKPGDDTAEGGDDTAAGAGAEP